MGTFRGDDSASACPEKGWFVQASEMAVRTENPIRKVVDGIDVRPNPNKHMIPLSIGDPTVFGNLAVPENISEIIVRKARSMKHNGYLQATGDSHARAAVAKCFSNRGVTYQPGDVVLASGGSGALNMAICVLANPGDNVLLPNPGFPLYSTICQHYGIECRFYNLVAEDGWIMDVTHAESLIDARTAAIVTNNPSNPCGSVYSREHLVDILALAERHRILIVSDEIYADMVFEGHVFHPLAGLAERVPVLTVGGLAKQYLVPGWRMGWVLVHDPVQALKQVRQGLTNLAGIILGPNSLVQAALADLFEHTPRDFFHDTMHLLYRNTHYFISRILDIPALDAVEPQGAMYIMVRIQPEALADIADDREFAQKLLAEESVLVLPGQCFGIANYFRVVTSAPLDKLSEACDRIALFCERHKQN